MWVLMSYVYTTSCRRAVVCLDHRGTTSGVGGDRQQTKRIITLTNNVIDSFQPYVLTQPLKQGGWVNPLSPTHILDIFLNIVLSVLSYSMEKDKKEVEYDVFDLMTGRFEELEGFEVEETFKTFAEHYEYYNAERDIARKIMIDMLCEAKKTVLECEDESTD